MNEKIRFHIMDVLRDEITFVREVVGKGWNEHNMETVHAKKGDTLEIELRPVEVAVNFYQYSKKVFKEDDDGVS